MRTFDLNNTIDKIYSNCNNFVVIGAYDGESYDTFFQQILKRRDNNATVLFVEPVSKCFNKLLVKTQKLNRYKIICDKSAISDKNEAVTVASVKEEHINKYPWYIGGCSSVVENNKPINIYLKDIPSDHLDYESIDCLTFDSLIIKHGLFDIDFLQIDTEGYDQRIVENIDFVKYNINFLKFEFYYLSTGFLDSFKNKIGSLGYSFCGDRDNCHFIKTSFLDSFQ